MLRTFDDWKTSDPSDDASEEPLIPCPICTGAEDAAPCGEDCAALLEKCERKNQIARLEVAAESTIYMARRYLEEAPAPDKRVLECVDQLGIYLRQIRSMRAA